MISRRNLMTAAAAAPLFAGSALAQAQSTSPAKAPARNISPPTIAELCSRATLSDCALSHDGQTIAVLRHIGGPDGKNAAFITLHPFDNLPASKTVAVPEEIHTIDWVNNERLVCFSRGVSQMISPGVDWTVTSTQLGFLDREGKQLDMTNQAFARRGMVFSHIVDYLPSDPRRIVVQMRAIGNDSAQLFYLDVYDVTLTLIEKGQSSTSGWICQDGKPLMRMDFNRSGKVMSLMRRQDDGRYSLVRKIASQALYKPDFDVLAATPDPGVFYVSARAEGDQMLALHRYDLKTESFAGVVSRRADRDLDSISMDKFGRYLGAVYVDDRVAYDPSDTALNATLETLNSLYRGANVRIYDISENRSRVIAHVEGPKHAGGYVMFDAAKRALALIGDQRPWLNTDRLTAMTALDIKTRDGQTIRAYLTDPGGAGPRPMVVMPHGGPEVRDQLQYDMQVQALAAQGWLVLQPNFRGSGGYGAAFARAGHRRWNGRVSEDIEDAADQLIASGRVDRRRVAIMGASFGGYAALMAGARRPDFWRGVVSIAGVSDLERMLQEERADGEDSPVYQYWLAQIGDPKTDAAAVAAASPAKQVEAFKVPVLLFHGAEDWIVPIEQSRIMQRALRRAGKSVELVEFKEEGHGGWTSDVSEALLTKTVAYLKRQFEAA